jgi:hypothetical protein
LDTELRIFLTKVLRVLPAFFLVLIGRSERRKIN